MPQYAAFMNLEEDRLLLEFGKVLKEQKLIPDFPVKRSKSPEGALRHGITKYLLRNVVKQMQEAQKAKG